MGLKEKYREAWEALIKPAKFQFPREALGMPKQLIDGQIVHREDFTVANCDGFKLEGSFYHPENAEGKSLDIVMYLHTRGGTRLEGVYLINVLLPKMGLVVFDFAGSGYSEGEFITLGAKESRDVRLVIDRMRSNHNIGRIILWGRSMGAVASILFAAEPSNKGLISGMILDSPFSSFRRMIYDVVTIRKNVPLCIINAFLYFILKTIKAKTGVNLSKIEPIQKMAQIDLPGFFIVAHDDIISRPDKVKDLYLTLRHETKEFHLVQGEHNSQRDKIVILNALYFMLKCVSSRSKNSNEGWIETHKAE
jgi:alpha/beta superfamily hydrolase